MQHKSNSHAYDYKNTGNSPEETFGMVGKTGNLRKNQNHRYDSIIKISKNTEEGAGELRRLTVIFSESHQI